MSKTLKLMVVNELDKQRGLSQYYAEIAGYSSSSAFRKVLLDEEKEIEKLDGFIKVVQLLFPDDYRLLLNNFAKKLNPDKITARMMLEYATLYHFDDLKTIILKNFKKSTKSETKEWLHVYETDHLIAIGKLGLIEGINELNSRKYSRVETRVYSKIAQTYCYYDCRNICMIKAALKEVEDEVKLIKNDFIRNAYEGRIFRMKVDINLHNDKIGELLTSGFQLENALPPTRSYIFTDW